MEPSSSREFGRAAIELLEPAPLFEGVLAPGERADVWMSHGDKVVEAPPGFTVFARSDNSPIADLAVRKEYHSKVNIGMPFYGRSYLDTTEMYTPSQLAALPISPVESGQASADPDPKSVARDS